MCLPVSHLRNLTRDGLKVEENVRNHQMMVLTFWLNDNPNQAPNYISDGTTSTAASTPPRSNATNSEASSDEKMKKQKPSQQFAHTGTRLLLSTKGIDNEYAIGNIREPINEGFFDKTACTTEMYGAIRKSLCRTLSKMTEVTYAGMQINPCSATHYSNIANGRWSKDDPFREEVGTISFASFTAFDKRDSDDIKANNYNFFLDANVDQATHNFTRIIKKKNQNL